MFGRLKRVRVRAAEDALKAGRLEDALRMVLSPDLAGDRRTQKLLAAVASAYWERAHAHYDAGRYSEALIDVERAARAGRDKSAVAALSSEIRGAAHQSGHRRKEKARRLAEAKQEIHDGQLTMGRRILDQVTQADPHAKVLREEAAARDADAAADLAEAQALLKKGDVTGALSKYRRAAKLDVNDAEAKQLEKQLCDRVVADAKAALDDGRIDRARDTLAMLGDVAASDNDRKDIEDAVERVTRLGRLCERADFAEALREIRRVRRLLPKASWLREAEDKLSKIDQAYDALMSGPLGLMVQPVSVGAGQAPIAGKPPATPKSPSPRVVAPAVRTPGAGRGSSLLPDRLLVLVDGAGSYLLVRKDRARIGRLTPGSGRQPDETAANVDIGLLADIASDHADVARVEDDYFLFARQEAAVNGRSVSQTMLTDGGRIRLGRNAELTFRLPSKRSPSAVLDLSSRLRMGGDVRRVILFSGHAMIGHARTAHIRVPTARRDLVLFERSGQLFVRAFSSRPEERFNSGSATPLVLGEHVEVDGIGLSVEPWHVVAV